MFCSRNCTKHQVQCDYVDGSPDAADLRAPSPIPSNDRLSPFSEDISEVWQPPVELPFDIIGVMPPQQSPTEMQFIDNLTSTFQSLTSRGVCDLTLWAPTIPR